jgi:hypothetical protein
MRKITIFPRNAKGVSGIQDEFRVISVTIGCMKIDDSLCLFIVYRFTAGMEVFDEAVMPGYAAFVVIPEAFVQ